MKMASHGRVFRDSVTGPGDRNGGIPRLLGIDPDEYLPASPHGSPLVR